MRAAHYDLAVVGAGFAGLSCAWQAARHGLSVCVLERQREVGATVHTTGLLVKEVAEHLQPPAALLRRIDGVRLYTPALRYVDLQAPGYYFAATDTPALLRWAAALARREGVQIRCGQRFRNARRGPGVISVNDGELAAGFLVGADGARSRVAACFGLGHNREFLYGVEAELADAAGCLAPGLLHCFVDARLAPGYIGWAFAGVGDVVQVGLACRPPQRPDHAALLDKIAAVADLRSARLLGMRAGLIPVGGPLRQAQADRVILVGDAAGLVSPLTAGGIHLAVESGLHAGAEIASILAPGHQGPARRARLLRPRMLWKRTLRRLFDLPLGNALLERLLLCGPVLRVARLVYFYRKGLHSGSGWRALFTRPAARSSQRA